MSEGLQTNKKPHIWVDYEASMGLSGCAKRYDRNRPFVANLAAIFGYLGEKLKLLCNFGASSHVFLNPTLPEAHVLRAPPRETAEEGEFKYARVPLDGESWDGLKQALHGGQRGGVMRMQPTAFAGVLCKLDLTREDSDEENALVLSFAFGSVNMGTFLLWGRGNTRRQMQRPSEELVSGWLISYYSFLDSLFSREFTLSSATYLPSYYAARWSPVAVMFADIRNFTPLTEILRNAHAHLGSQETHRLRGIMDEHCREMASIIQYEQRGRIDKFLGDGIMALFGEHQTDPCKAVCRAVWAAVQMVERFAELKPQFLRRAFGGGYEVEYNESVEIDLGIGINFGTVLFDYLGDDRHREFTVVGDHVNFAQRLETEAARVDGMTNELRPPILLSATAERCIRPWLESTKPVILRPKGKGSSYTVFGLYPASFRRELYDTSEKHNDWSTPWGRHPCGPPEVGSG